MTFLNVHSATKMFILTKQELSLTFKKLKWTTLLWKLS